MCQNGHLLANSGRIRKVFGITSVVDTRTWILLDRQSTINVLCKCNILADMDHMKGYTGINCNVGIVHTSLAEIKHGNEQEIRWYHPQVIANFISLLLAIKHLHIIYDSQDRIVTRLHKPNGLYHEFRGSFRVLY